MTFDLNTLAVDPKAEEDGVVLMLAQDVGVRLRSAQSKHARDAAKKAWKPYRSVQLSAMPEAILAKITARVIVEGYVVRWLGDWIYGGKPLDTADPQAMIAFLARPEMRPLRKRMAGFAEADVNFMDVGGVGIEDLLCDPATADEDALGN